MNLKKKKIYFLSSEPFLIIEINREYLLQYTFIAGIGKSPYFN